MCRYPFLGCWPGFSGHSFPCRAGGAGGGCCHCFTPGTAACGDFHEVSQPSTSLCQDVQPGCQKLSIINGYATVMSNLCPSLPSLHPGRNQKNWWDLCIRQQSCEFLGTWEVLYKCMDLSASSMSSTQLGGT